MRHAGATVQDLHLVLKGCPKYLVGYKGQNFLMVINKGKLNAKEFAWHMNWQGQVAVVKTLDDALKVIGAL